MASESTLLDLLELELKDMFSAETQLTKALPKMAKAATNPKLKAGFEQHLKETERQIRRLEQVAEELDIRLKGKPCEGMKGLIEEGKEVIDLDAEEDVRDAALIAAAQKVEHYEIAAYGTLCSWAKLLGLKSIASTLGQSLEEEKRTDEKLSLLAEQQVNMQAA